MHDVVNMSVCDDDSQQRPHRPSVVNTPPCVNGHHGGHGHHAPHGHHLGNGHGQREGELLQPSEAVKHASSEEEGGAVVAMDESLHKGLLQEHGCV